jgi:hypothetical protein
MWKVGTGCVYVRDVAVRVLVQSAGFHNANQHFIELLFGRLDVESGDHLLHHFLFGLFGAMADGQTCQFAVCRLHRVHFNNEVGYQANNAIMLTMLHLQDAIVWEALPQRISVVPHV